MSEKEVKEAKQLVLAAREELDHFKEENRMLHLKLKQQKQSVSSIHKHN